MSAFSVSVRSQSASPATTSADSPDSLPQKGYTIDQLASYIFRQLGSPTWQVELTQQQVLDCINDALGLYSQWVPNIRVGSITLVRDQYRYLDGVDVEQGIADIQFVEPSPVPSDMFYLNIVNPAPIFRVGLDEYDLFMRWRKTWNRVTSVKPDWYYDEGESVLYIHNPIERYQAAVFIYAMFTNTDGLPLQGAQWVKTYALEKARYLLGEVWAKYSGAIPGPLQNLTLDQSKRDKAEARLSKLEESLRGMQRAAPISID